MHQAAAIVERDGTSTADAIAREIYGVTWEKARVALNNARTKGLVHCIGRVEGDKSGQRAGIFAPGPAPKKPAPNRPAHHLHSVWGAQVSQH
jgi:hypothetical protein